MRNIFVLGYFGYETNQLDGQTIKSRNIYQLLNDYSDKSKFNVRKFDTQSLKRRKSNFFNIIKGILLSDILVYIPAHRNLHFLFPFIFIFSVIFGTKIHLVVVGGWLVEFLENRPLHRLLLKRIAGVYPQTELMNRRLKQQYGFKNSQVLPNFRINNHVPAVKQIDKSLNLIFMARIHPQKGVETIFKLGKSIEYIENVRIDIYGPIFPEYELKFTSLLKTSRNVNYKGVVQPENIYNVFSSYDLTLFPTRYYTEGFPGTILDSYISGVPVVASRWLHATEFVDNESGVIAEFNNDEDFIEKTVDLIKNPDKIQRMKVGAIDKSQDFSPSKAWEILSSRF